MRSGREKCYASRPIWQLHKFQILLMSHMFLCGADRDGTPLGAPDFCNTTAKPSSIGPRHDNQARLRRIANSFVSPEPDIRIPGAARSTEDSGDMANFVAVLVIHTTQPSLSALRLLQDVFVSCRISSSLRNSSISFFAISVYVRIHCL